MCHPGSAPVSSPMWPPLSCDHSVLNTSMPQVLCSPSGTVAIAAWGTNVWVEAAGQAVADGETETMRDLYGAAAASWVDEGRTAHYVIVPASETALIASWFRLAFGHQHTHAIREVPAEPVTRSGDVTIRRAVRADIPALARLEVELPSHQRCTPVFSAAQPPTVEDAQRDWESDFDDPDYASFVAVRDGVVIGAAGGCPLARSSAHSGLAHPNAAGYLSFAAVSRTPEAWELAGHSARRCWRGRRRWVSPAW